MEKLPTGTASALLSKFVLIKIEAAVIGRINFSNRFSLLSDLGCPRGQRAMLPWMLVRAGCVGKPGRSDEGARGPTGQKREPGELS